MLNLKNICKSRISPNSQKLYKNIFRYFNADESKTYEVELPKWKSIDLDTSKMPTTTKITQKELMDFFNIMTAMRHMEVQCNKLYMDRLIRGFLHVYVGEESVALGIESAITKEDCVITGYRDHGIAMARGDSPYEILAENIGKRTGSTKGKGGSMHLYSKKHNFYGGHGIVGAQIAMGAGLALALKNCNKPCCAITMFGDGAANQGQYYEAANMAGIWKLPCVFLIENNHYGMGTSEQMAHSYLPIMGKLRGFPALHCDGSNIWAVKEATKFCKEYTIKNGPIVLEIDTYRYFGHGPSDPGITYRKAEEVQERRSKRDCIDLVRKYLIQNQVSTKEELDQKDKEISRKIRDDVQKAISDPHPDEKELLTHVYVEKTLPYIRAVEYEKSIFNEHKM